MGTLLILFWMVSWALGDICFKKMFRVNIFYGPLHYCRLKTADYLQMYPGLTAVWTFKEDIILIETSQLL